MTTYSTSNNGEAWNNSDENGTDNVGHKTKYIDYRTDKVNPPYLINCIAEVQGWPH